METVSALKGDVPGGSVKRTWQCKSRFDRSEGSVHERFQAVGYVRGILHDSMPIIGWSGAKLLGLIRIGNNMLIGANAVAMIDVSGNCIAVGVPAVVKPRGMSGGKTSG
jgi:hypothetical protein